MVSSLAAPSAVFEAKRASETNREPGSSDNSVQTDDYFLNEKHLSSHVSTVKVCFAFAQGTHPYLNIPNLKSLRF